MINEHSGAFYDGLVRARDKYSYSLTRFRYLEMGGLALGNHRIETLQALNEVKVSIEDIHYYENLLGIPASKIDTPLSRYEREQVELGKGGK